jgi:hypothetical protein
MKIFAGVGAVRQTWAGEKETEEVKDMILKLLEITGMNQEI